MQELHLLQPVLLLQLRGKPSIPGCPIQKRLSAWQLISAAFPMNNQARHDNKSSAEIKFTERVIAADRLPSS
jgi:hypothetical protein